VVFVLATTDPQKVPVTVLSRCLQFNLKLMPPARITEHLRRVLDGEQVQYEPGALNLLARAAAGSMRDALSLTDQAIAYGGGGLGEEETQAMLGVIDQAYLYPILEALADGDGARLMTEADRIASRSLSFDAALQDLSALVYQIGLAQTLPEAVSEDVPERERLFALAHRLDAETAQLFYQIACLGRRDLDWAPDEQTGFAMTLLRMLAFTPDNAGREASAEAPGTSGRGHTGSRAGRPGEVTTPASAAPLRPETGPTGDKAAGDLPDWIGLTRRLSGGAKQLASQCELVAWDGKRLKLRLHEEQKPLVSSFGDRLRVALGEHLAAGLDVEFEFGATAGTTPAQAASRENERRQSEAEAAIQNDPFVQAMVQGFEAKVSDIKPLQ
jgi:DNA polymerase-3 subunit gamma/tau